MSAAVLERPQVDPNRTALCRFVPSEDLAERALRMSGAPPNGPWGESSGAVWSRVYVAPSGPPKIADELVTKTRESIGIRVERLFASLARAAALFQRDPFVISAEAKFVPLVDRALANTLLLMPGKEEDVLHQLHAELLAVVDQSDRTVRGEWGDLIALTTAPASLALRLDPRFVNDPLIQNEGFRQRVFDHIANENAVMTRPS